MRVALVSSDYSPHSGVVGAHAHELAVGLALRGIEVEVIAQDLPPRLPAVSEFDGFVVRRFAAPFRSARFAVAPALWEHLRCAAPTFDVVHVHSPYVSFALAAARARPRRLLFTLHAPVPLLLRRPHTSLIRALIGQGVQIICTTQTDREALLRTFPRAAQQVGVVLPGLDVAAIRGARPFAYPGAVVLAIGRLERHQRIDRAIAAMAALEPEFRLAVVGQGPAADRLLAYASDLQVSSRVRFVGPVADAELHRWLRTASVVVALAEHASSGLRIAEALCAGAPVVASDIPVHREFASYADSARVRFVPSVGSPLDVADEIREAADAGFSETYLELPTWDDAVERTLAMYTQASPGVVHVLAGGD